MPTPCSIRARPSDPRAEEVFREYLARVEPVEPADFEAICRANRKLERHLRRLKDSLDVINRLRLGGGDGHPLRGKFAATLIKIHESLAK